MVRRLLTRALPAAMVALAIGAAAWATTVLPVLTPCPVCGKPSVVSEICTDSSIGEPARDLRDSPFARFTRIRTCPYCLYSSLNSDFADVAPAEQAALKSSWPIFTSDHAPRRPTHRPAMTIVGGG